MAPQGAQRSISSSRRFSLSGSISAPLVSLGAGALRTAHLHHHQYYAGVYMGFSSLAEWSAPPSPFGRAGVSGSRSRQSGATSFSREVTTSQYFSSSLPTTKYSDAAGSGRQAQEVKQRCGFVQFVNQAVRAAQRGSTPLAYFLKKHYIILCG